MEDEPDNEVKEIPKTAEQQILDNLLPTERPLLVGKLEENNIKCSYNFYDLNRIITNNGKVEETPIECVDYKKCDYPIPLTDEITDKFKPKLAFETECNVVPLSFLGIKEGDVELGKCWYMNNDPKLPDEIAELMARYSFGDLKYMTKKEAKNKRKKLAKKGEDIIDSKLKVNRGAYKIDFD